MNLKHLTITWPTVALAGILAAAVCVLVIFGETDLAAIVGAVGTLLGAGLRQAIYRKPRSEWTTDPQIDISGLYNTQDGRWNGDGRVQ